MFQMLLEYGKDVDQLAWICIHYLNIVQLYKEVQVEMELDSTSDVYKYFHGILEQWDGNHSLCCRVG